jgi:hypothetical protein
MAKYCKWKKTGGSEITGTTTGTKSHFFSE